MRSKKKHIKQIYRARKKRNNFIGAFKFLEALNLQSHADDRIRTMFLYVSGVDFFSMSVCHVKIKTAHE